MCAAISLLRWLMVGVTICKLNIMASIGMILSHNGWIFCAAYASKILM